MEDFFQHLFVRLVVQRLFTVLHRRGIYNFQNSYESQILGLLKHNALQGKKEGKIKVN